MSIGVIEAAAVLGTSAPTLRRRITHGEIGAEKIGRTWVITDPVIIRQIQQIRDRRKPKAPHVSERVRTKGQAIFRDRSYRLLAGGPQDKAWLFVVYSPKPHLCAGGIVPQGEDNDAPVKSMLTCDCEWMASLKGKNTAQLVKESQICAHLYVAYLAITEGVDMG